MTETIVYEYFITNGETIINIIIFFILTVWVHEGIHYKVAEGYGLKPKIGLDWKGLYTTTEIEPTREQERDILWDSILLGMIPVFASGFLIGLWCLALLASYIIGIIPDLKILRENYANT